MPTIPDNAFEIVPTQSGSDSEYILRDNDDESHIGFDYTGRVTNGNLPEQIAFYKDGIFMGSFPLRMIDADITELNETLLTEDAEFDESDI